MAPGIMTKASWCSSATQKTKLAVFADSSPQPYMTALARRMSLTWQDPPGDPRYYEILTTAIGKLRYSTVARRQKGQWSPCLTQKICTKSFWGCQRWDWTVKTGHITFLKWQFWSQSSTHTLSETWMPCTRIISFMARALQTVEMKMTECNHRKQHTIKRKPWVKAGR